MIRAAVGRDVAEVNLALQHHAKLCKLASCLSTFSCTRTCVFAFFDLKIMRSHRDKTAGHPTQSAQGVGRGGQTKIYQMS